MRRILAGLAAVAMVVGGFVVHAARTDPERGKAPLRLWCVTEAAEACRALASARLTVVIATPVEIENHLKSVDPQNLDLDAVITGPMWADRSAVLPPKSLANPRGEVGTPMAATRLVAVQRQSANSCKGKIGCLVALKAKFAVPSLTDTLSGTLVAAGAFADAGIDALAVDSDPGNAMARNVRSTLRPVAQGITPLQALTSLRIVDATVLTQAEYRQAAPAATTATPLAPAIDVLLVAVRYRADDRLDDLLSRLRAELFKRSWDAPGSSAHVPPTDLLNAVYEVLR